MPRRRSRPLPPGVYERTYRNGTRAYWVWFYDAAGERVQERGGTSLDEAVRHRTRRLADVASGSFARGVGSSTQSVETYARHWLELRAAEGKRTVTRERQLLRDYVLPVLGKTPLGDVRPRHVADLVRGLEGKMSSKSVRNVHGVLSTLLARARFEDLIVDNPAAGLPRGVLPEARREREVGAWTRDEVARWITPHPDVPEERTVTYAIAAFTGARVGEIAGLRWRDLDVAAKPLWRWALRTQYDGEALKTGRPRDIPIHAELARILAAWKVGGWARFMCRIPRPEDFVVPRNPTLSGARPQHLASAHHSKSSLGAKAIRRHAVALGIDSTGRDFHSFRRSLITLARTDGAAVDVLERVTHNARGETIDGYTYFGWDTLCAAVSCLRLAPLPEGTETVVLLRKL